jgi:choice-of-anchor C domain-containing protein
VYPDSDVFLVPAGSVTAGGVLTDASGGLPNTVRGTSTGGLIISEVVGATGPTGTLGTGTYDVVFDECQNGKYDVGTDAVFERAVEVVVPADIPGLPNQAILDMKRTAGGEATFWATATQDMTIYLNTLELLGLVTGLKDGGTKGIDDPIMYFAATAFGTQLPDVKLAALQLMLNTAKHWRAISDDPPDPDFRQVTVLAAQPQLEAPVDTPLAGALYALAESAGSEAAVAEALLRSMERYQGADEADDPHWARIHARAVRDHATLLRQQLPSTDVRIDALLDALRADTRDYDEELAELESVRARIVADGFTDAQVRELTSAGSTAAELEAFRAQQADVSWAGASESALVSQLEQLRAGRAASAGALAGFATAMQPIIDALAPAAESVPLADAGGPYSGTAGTAVSFDAGRSTSPTAITSYEWDLDGDGAFDDAATATATFTYTSSWSGVVSLRVRNAAGLTGVDQAQVVITDGGSPPRVGAATPAGDTALVTVGETRTFTVEPTSASGPPTVRWERRGVPVGSGPSFGFTPTDADVGVHPLVAVVEGGTPAGGSARRTWLVLVLPRDADADGWRTDKDCDDSDADVNPGATEVVGNGKDDDCDPGTAELGAAPVARYAATGESENVALAERGATIAASSGSPYGGHTAEEMVDFSSTDLPWAAGRPETAPYAVIDLPGSHPYAVDAVQVRPRTDYPDQRVKQFAVDVSSTTTDPAAFRTVLTATAAGTAELQTFRLPERAFAKYVRYRPLSGNGGSTCGGCISTQQLRVLSPQWQDGSVSFVDLSTPGQADITGHLWEFGDGTTSTAANPTHVYAQPGSYTVRLTTTSADGQSSSWVTTQVVQAAPAAAWDRSAPSGAPYEGDTVTLVDRSTPVAPATVVQREFSWGDGAVTAGGSHAYGDDGTYAVSLEVLDSAGAIGRVTRDLTVLNRAPVVDAGNDLGWVGGKELVVSALRDRPAPRISDAGRTDTWTCSWDYGDQTPPGSGCDFVHTYEHTAPWGTAVGPKSFTATLTVTDEDGATSSDQVVVDVRPKRTPAPENLVKDGDFETVSAGQWYRYLHSTDRSLAPWTIEGDSVDLLSTYFQDAASGAQSLNLNGSGPGGVSQVVPTVPGATYRLRFAVAANVEGGDPVVRTDVAWGGTSLGVVSFDARGDDRRKVGWRYEERLVTATAASTRLAFTSPDQTAYGPVVDDVSLVLVEAANRPPVARDVPGVTTPEGVPVRIRLDAVDPDGDPLVHTVVTPPAHGRLTGPSGDEVTYVPADGYSGPDSFTYRVNDGKADSGTATVSIEVSPGNRAPVAVDDVAATPEDTPVQLPAATLLGNDTDADGDALSVVVTSQPAHGAVVQQQDGSLTYTPAADFSGADSFTYTASDGTAASSPATVALTVSPVNDAPRVVVTPVQGVVEGGTRALSATATDVDGDVLTLRWEVTAGGGRRRRRDVHLRRQDVDEPGGAVRRRRHLPDQRHR